MKKPSKDVKVVIAPTTIPGSSSVSTTTMAVSHPVELKSGPRRGEPIDFRETMREVCALGSKRFEGSQKKNYEAERYKDLIGRYKKQQRVPLKISRGIKKKAAVREARRISEAREAGIILGSRRPEGKKLRYPTKNSKQYGPVPSIGSTKNGVLCVRKP